MPDTQVKPNPRPAVSGLRCQGADCDGLLAYEVDREERLHVDLAWTARQDAGQRYLPCPKCGGRNLLEPATDAKGRPTHAVVGFAR